jgi:hypothetical protein
MGGSRKGYWRTAGSPPLHLALPNAYWRDLGLRGFTVPYRRFRDVTRTAGCGPARPVVWEGEGDSPRPDPIQRRFHLVFTFSRATRATIRELRSDRRRGGRRIAIAPAAIAAAALLACALAPPATSAVFGQLESWGAAGTGAGQFNKPGECALFGADPVDGSIYVGDMTADEQSCRIQKLSPGGESEASVTIPRFGPAPLKPLLGWRGIAVDHDRGRIYLIEGSLKVTTVTALQIRVYAAEPSAGGLVPPAGGPATLALPTGEAALKNPTSIAVDPADGDLVILAEDAKKEHAVLQRIGADGKFGPRFVDAGDVLRPLGKEARAIAVGPDGTTFALTGKQSGGAGEKDTRAWELPPALSEVHAVSGFAAAAESEAWKSGLLKDSASPAVGGPQIAISPDGETLYWKENREDSSPQQPGEVAIRGYSLSKGTTGVVYGAHPYEEGKGICAIGTGMAPIATTGGKLVVFDHAFPPSGGSESYGPPRVVTFGPGGSGCSAQAEAKLAIDGVLDEPVTVQKGVDVVSFDATESEIGGPIDRVEWDFGDGSAVETVPGPEAALSITHRYLAAGSFTIELRIVLAGEGAPTGEDSGSVEVVAATPQAFLDVLDPPGFSVAPGGTATFDASESWDPSGGKCTQAAGCPGGNEMASYRWSFGDGSPEETTAVPTVSHQFANPDSAPLQRLITLTVESVEGEADSDARLITVQGTPGRALVTPDEPPLPPSEAPAPSPGSGKKGKQPDRGAEQRQRLIRQCRKKKGQARRRCLKRARTSGKHERRRGES